MKFGAERGKEGELRAQEWSDSAMSEGKKPYRLLSHLAIPSGHLPLYLETLP